MDNLEKTVVLDSGDEETPLEFVSTTVVCACSTCATALNSSDSTIFYTACPQLDLSFDEFETEDSKTEMLKRSISSSSSFDQAVSKKSKTTLFTSSQISNVTLTSKKTVSSEQIWNEDERLSKIFYYNRIDDSDFDPKIYVSSLIERIIDKVTIGKPKYTIEHYFHLKKKSQQVEHNTHLCADFTEKLERFIKCNEDNKTDLIWNEMQRQTAKRRLDDHLQIKKISEDDYKSFKEFLEEIYEKFELID